jgi:Ca2+-binding RTX toxin-like protein
MNLHTKLVSYLGLAAAATTATALVHVGPADAAAYQQASASVADNTLTVVGTDDADTVSVAFSADGVTATVDLGNGTVTQTFERQAFNAVTVVLRAGNDQFRAISGGTQVADPRLTVYGGDGDDDLRGGRNADVLFGDDGRDTVDGGVGADTQILGTGADTAVWLPGEGSDVVIGGPGKDTLEFFGSNLSEVMALAASGDAAAFTRDLGGIRMDLDGVEALDLSTLGGADLVTVDNQPATGVLKANIDLSVPGGAGDGQADVVVVNGTDAADKVDVSARAGVVDVKGLPTRTVITGGELRDVLAVNTLSGNDRVVVDDDVSAVIGTAFGPGTRR